MKGGAVGWGGREEEAGQQEREVARRVFGWKCCPPQPSLEPELPRIGSAPVEPILLSSWTLLGAFF